MRDAHLTESDLIIQIRAGSIESFTSVFKMYYAPLCSYAATFVKCRDMAEEIVQETFIHFWEARHNIYITTSLRSYLYRSVRNNCISHIRSKIANRKVYDNKYHHVRMIARSKPVDVLDSIIFHELERFLSKVIDRLPEQCNRVFSLSRDDKLTHKEIASKLGISVNTVKTQLSRAFLRLKVAYIDFKNY